MEETEKNGAKTERGKMQWTICVRVMAGAATIAL